MTDYTAIADEELDPDGPITSMIGYRFRDNPVAMAEGATGAPRLADAALAAGTGNTTAAGSEWVRLRVALGAAGAVGTYAMARYASVLAFGATVSGGSLIASPAGGAGGSTTLSGTWRCVGFVAGSGDAGNVSLFLRIS